MRKITVLLFISVLFFSCSSDEVKSSENYIEKFEIVGISPIEIGINNDIFLIYVRTYPENLESLLSKEPIIEISEKATLSKSGENWAEEGFEYIVTAENGESRIYHVKIDVSVPKKYSFETWKLSEGASKYYMPSDFNSRWTSGNAGISMALEILKIGSENPENYPTKKTSEGYSGNAVVMKTIEGGNVFGRDLPIISGNFFLGNFNVTKSITDVLAAIEVGSVYPAKPRKVKGFYKYREGSRDFINNGITEPGRRDSCNLHISFYQGDSPSSGKDTTLTVKEIDAYNSELVIADATLADCSETAGDGFHQFTLDFGEYISEPDFQNHYYKIAITFAASRNGGNYAGKIGSTLIVDEVEIEDY